jgi:hypothetical protein
MSAYDDYDQPRRYHSTRTRQRDRDEPDYVREETYIERGKGPGPRDLVFRGRDDSIEDIPREFPPPAARDYRKSRDYDEYSAAPRRTRSTASRRTRDYDEYSDRYTDYAAPAAAGAAAGYAAGRRRDRSRRRDDRDYDSEYSRSPPRRPKNDRKKSGVEEVLGGLGLGGVAAALTGKSRDRSADRSVRSRSTRRGGRRGSSSSSRSRSRSRDRGKKKGQTERQWAQAAQAAVIAGAVEAFRSRKEPGPWTGDRGKRIATAAIGAGGIDKFLDRNPDEKSKRHLAEAVVGGLAANRLANGPRSKSRGPRNADSRAGSPDSFATGRSGRARSRSIIDRFRGRSQSRGRDASPKEGGGNGGLKGLVAGGALAAAGKTIYDRVRSKSRKRRSPSSSSADSYVPSRTRRRDRRRSPNSDTGSTRRSHVADDRRREIRDSRDTNDPYTASGGQLTRGAAAGGAVGAGKGAGGGAGGRNQTGREDDLSDSSSTTDMENKRKRMRGKEFLTAGLASIATIHAAHGIYSSMEAHEKRHRLVAEGEMTPEEARKKQTKAWVQDAAAVGIAALGIKGAFSEWKGMNEQRYGILTTRLRGICQSSWKKQANTITDARSNKSNSASANAASVCKPDSANRNRNAKSACCKSWPRILKWQCSSKAVAICP